MAECVMCGASLRDGATFCRRCGSRQKAATAPAEPTRVTPLNQASVVQTPAPQVAAQPPAPASSQPGAELQSPDLPAEPAPAAETGSLALDPSSAPSIPFEPAQGQTAGPPP